MNTRLPRKSRPSRKGRGQSEPLFGEAAGQQGTRLDDAADSEVSLAPLPPRPVPVLEVNAGLTLSPGDTAGPHAAAVAASPAASPACST